LRRGNCAKKYSLMSGFQDSAADGVRRKGRRQVQINKNKVLITTKTPEE